MNVNFKERGAKLRLTQIVASVLTLTAVAMLMVTRVFSPATYRTAAVPG